jgi:HPt (histidine-containing phosphotransfer) domain-containing protein
MPTSALSPLPTTKFASGTSRQRVLALEQALLVARAEAAATWHLLALSLGEASDGVLLVDGAQCVRLANALLGQLFGLPASLADWAGQPAALAQQQLRAQLAAPAALDLLLTYPAAGYVPLPLLSGQLLEVNVRLLPASAGGGYLLRSRATAPAQPALVPQLSLPSLAALPDLTYLYTQAQGNQALVTKIINSFLRTTPPLLLELRAAADAGHWETVARLVHHLQSNMQVLGIRQAEACLEVLQAPLPPTASGPAAATFAQATYELANCLEATLRVLPSYLP